MLLPTIPAPITTTRARAGRPATRIPSSVIVAGSQHTEGDHAIRTPRDENTALLSASSGEHLLELRSENPHAEPGHAQPEQPPAESAAGAGHRDVDQGAAGRSRPYLIVPAAAGRPAVRLGRLGHDLPGAA